MKGSLGLLTLRVVELRKKEERRWEGRGLEKSYLNACRHFLLGDVKHIC